MVPRRAVASCLWRVRRGFPPATNVHYRYTRQYGLRMRNTLFWLVVVFFPGMNLYCYVGCLDWPGFLERTLLQLDALP